MDLTNKVKVPELLAPAGSLAHLKAAIHAGADAVYMGGQRFSARAYADNFSEEDMLEALRYAHFYNRRLYLTVNTLLKDMEIEVLYEFLAPYYEAGLDGVIVQDMGVASFIRDHFPGMEVHGSTQMTITSKEGALAAKRFGMTRVVPARELTLAELKAIKEESGLEIEVFGHGALCYCYSGQCLMSSTYGGRSGNRGRCAQPCRLTYQLQDEKGKVYGKPVHMLSPKDLCSYPILEELCAIGIDSLKIEGRMKNIEYVAGVTAVYRQALDDIAAGIKRNDKKIKEGLAVLEELYHREGFTDGYFKNHNGAHMMAVHYPKNIGREIGQIIDCKKFQITIALKDKLAGQDVVVIPLDSQEEIVLTVPQEGSNGKKISLRLPKGARVEKGMKVYRRRSEDLISHIKREYIDKKPCYLVKFHAEFLVGKEASLTLSCQGEEVHVTGQVVEPASKRAVTKVDILRQLGKTGEVPFELGEGGIDLEEGCFYPMSWVKELRQKGFGLLIERLEHRGDRQLGGSDSEGSDAAKLSRMHLSSVVSEYSIEENAADSDREKREKQSGYDADAGQRDSDNIYHALSDHRGEQKPVKRIATIYKESQLTFCMEHDNFFGGIVFPAEFFMGKGLVDMAKMARAKGFLVYYSMPRIWRREKAYSACQEEILTILKQDIFDGFYIYQINEAELLQELGILSEKMIFAASLYQWNHEAIEEYDRLYGRHISELAYELSIRDWQDLLDKARTVSITGSDPGQVVSDQNIVESDQVELDFSQDMDHRNQVELDYNHCNDYEMLVYGRYPVMLSAQCMKATKHMCNHTREMFFLKDQKGRKLPVTTHCDACYNIIWKDAPWNLLGEDMETLAPAISRHRFDFFMMKEEDMTKVIKDYEKWSASGYQEVYA